MSTGQQYRLLAVGEELAPVNQLDGHIVDVWGQRAFRTIRVTSYKVPTGRHDMTAWVGRLRLHGSHMALDDINTEAMWLVHPDSDGWAREHLGRVVLLEGYVKGPQTIVVMFKQQLD
jgi:hypothetical protein